MALPFPNRWSPFIVAALMPSQPPAPTTQPAVEPRVFYRTVEVNGGSIFYSEAGRKDAPTLLLLHGFPSSSRMFQPLLLRLADRYHLVAPDYPGFGHSEWPNPKQFAYTFDHIAATMVGFTGAIGLMRIPRLRDNWFRAWRDQFLYLRLERQLALTHGQDIETKRCCWAVARRVEGRSDLCEIIALIAEC